MLMIREGVRRVNEPVVVDASQERVTDGALMEQNAGLATPKIAGLDFTPLEYVLPREKAYGMARALNFRRTVALVTVTTDEGSVGYGDVLGLLALIGEYLALLAPVFHRTQPLRLRPDRSRDRQPALSFRRAGPSSSRP